MRRRRRITFAITYPSRKFAPDFSPKAASFRVSFFLALLQALTFALSTLAISSNPEIGVVSDVKMMTARRLRRPPQGPLLQGVWASPALSQGPQSVDGRYINCNDSAPPLLSLYLLLEDQYHGADHL